MSRRELVSVLVKVMGIYFLIRIVAGAPLTVVTTTTFGGREHLVSELYRLSFIVGVAILGAVLSITLIRNSDAVARWVCPEEPEPRELGGMAFADWQALGFNLVGLVLLVGALASLTSAIVTFKLMQRYDLDVASMSASSRNPVARMVSAGVTLLAGLVLFFSPRGLTQWWENLQKARRFEDDHFEEN